MPLDTRLDCHMHSTYSDGSHTIEQVTRSAAEKGLTTIAVTDHMPLPFATRYAMDRDRLDNYRQEISREQSRFDGKLTILSGLEMEFIPQHRQWIKEIAGLGWDMLLVSIHGIMAEDRHHMVNGREDEFIKTLEEVFNGDIQAFCARYFSLIQEAVSTGWFHVAAHLDVIKKHNLDNTYFDETSPWYRDLIRRTLEAMADSRVRLEINTNGINHPAGAPYPSEWVIREAGAMGIPLILGSDAHSPRFQGQYFDRIQALIQNRS